MKKEKTLAEVKTKKKEVVKETKTETKPKEKKTRTKKDKVVLNQVDQKRYRILCNVIRILAKIGRIALMIVIPFIILFMIAIPIVFSKIEISSNIIKYNSASIIIKDNEISYKIGDNVEVIDDDIKHIEDITSLINNNSKGKITFLLELSLLLTAIIIILEINILSFIETLFNNFRNDKTPFTKENTDIILLLFKYLLALKIIVILLSIFNVFDSDISTISILELLIIVVTYYIFKYGTEISNEKIKICD